MKALVNHVPSAEDMNDLLKEFTVDFLLKGYSSLATDLRLKLMSDDVDIDKSHFLWLITYFLKFASQLEVELEQIGNVHFYFISLQFCTPDGVTKCVLYFVDFENFVIFESSDFCSFVIFESSDFCSFVVFRI